MKPKRLFLVSAQANDLDWITRIRDRMEIGVEIKDFAVPGISSGEVEPSFEMWHLWCSAVTNTTVLVHAPFYDLIPGSIDPEVAELASKRHSETLNAAEALNAKGVVFHSGFNPLVRGPSYRQRWLDNTARYFSRLMAQHPGFTFLIENMWESSPEILADLVDTVNSPQFKVCLDVGQVQIFSKEPCDVWAQKLGLRLGHLHLNDNDGTWDQETALGTGIIPIMNIFPVLNSLGYFGTITFEVRGQEAVLKSMEFLIKHGIS